MSEQIPLGEEGDRPIIIQGGGSVNVIVPPNFSEQGISLHGKDFKNGNVNLISLQIDQDTPITLNKNAKITITYK
ncbi:MAG TPA: hypothetical protein VEY11_20345 [Pyrinomonadaceae bacterium]|nr:hypothetical protein [Pyrinomonadaceae bacterium]